jgi:hypothetical protein
MSLFSKISDAKEGWRFLRSRQRAPVVKAAYDGVGASYAISLAQKETFTRDGLRAQYRRMDTQALRNLTDYFQAGLVRYTQHQELSREAALRDPVASNLHLGLEVGLEVLGESTR